MQVTCRASRLALTIAAGLLLAASVSADVAPFSAKRGVIGRACRLFSSFDHNGDGTVEIENLRLVDLGHPTDENRNERDTVLILVEPRLLASTGALHIQPSLRTFAADLATEGHDTYVISADVYDGVRHQDGRTVLAVRAFLRHLWNALPDLRGALLVGNFPEATIVRQYYWLKKTPIALNKGKPNEVKFEKAVEYIRDKAELVAWRADLILADLDGAWDALYQEAPQELPYFIAVCPDGVEAADSVSDLYEFGTDTFEDFFFVHDGKWRMQALGGGKLRFSQIEDENDECSPDDLALPNPMARPDILISRINAYHAGVEPKAELPGAEGQSLLDEDGEPQTVTFPDAKSAPRGVGVWEHSEQAERRLLVQFFDRNHRYRMGEYDAVRKPSCISTEFGSSIPYAKKVFREWRDLDEPEHDIDGKETDLLECVRWLKRPALLRFLKAHSDPWGSTFAKTKDVEALEAELGGTVRAWRRDGGSLVPGVENCAKLDFAIHRTLWQNALLPDCAVMYFHIGCESTAPQGAPDLPYNDPKYGYWQGAESLMFYCNGIVLVGRSKVFYDAPRGFLEVLEEGGTWGDAWAGYFDIESAAEDVNKVGGGIGRKRAYFWSVLGDWTLRL